jgi:peptidoglycan/LPS O-acetylase OafA/YrhL
MDERLEFANALRGIACLAVVSDHFLGVFWFSPVASEIINAPPMPSAAAPWFTVLTATFSLGAYGVALFFILSGFLIPASLEKQNCYEFLIARSFRILPTYAAGFAVTVAAIAVTTAWFGRSFPYALWEVAAHFIPVLRGIAGAPHIDAIVWTLEIEIFFYALCAAIAGFLRRGSLLVFLAPFAIIAAGILMPYWFPSDTAVARGVGLFSVYSPYLGFMFCGTAIYYVHRKLMTPSFTAALIAGLLVAIWFAWPALSRPLISTYAGSLATFAAAYSLRTVVGWPTLLHRAANISYPLYVVHPVLGYAMIRAGIEAKLPPIVAVTLAFAVVLVFAIALHYAVEQPTRLSGKRFARQLTRALALHTVPGP